MFLSNRAPLDVTIDSERCNQSQNAEPPGKNTKMQNKRRPSFRLIGRRPLRKKVFLQNKCRTAPLRQGRSVVFAKQMPAGRINPWHNLS